MQTGINRVRVAIAATRIDFKPLLEAAVTLQKVVGRTGPTANHRGSSAVLQNHISAWKP